jgi:branched chain amino acid efflux pump
MPANSSLRRGVRDSVLIFFAVASFGVAYGVLAIDVGLGSWLALFSSMVIVSGAAQFALVGLIAAGPIPVLLAATGLGLRHLPMSATLARLIGPQPLGTRLRLAFILVDETFGLTIRAAAAGVEDLVAYKTAADISLYSGFVLGTAVGVWFGTAIDPQVVGVGVLFGLLFLGLAAPMIERRRDWLVAAASIVATILAIAILPSAWQITSAAVAAAVVGVAAGE